MTEEALLPCPFCGGEADWNEREGATGAQYYVECIGDESGGGFARCISQDGGYARKSEAIKAWNTRAPAIEAEEFDQVEARKELTDKAREVLKRPLVQSLLYDINLLPEQITKKRHWFYMLAVLGHMDQAMGGTDAESA